ncbi:helix-turn-helix domain-containing protein [Patescibacteria group bacterium]
MRIEEFESLLEGRSESQRIEFKTAHPWDVNLFAKDILALSNVRGGGYIIVGVDDKSFNRKGVSPNDLKTYDIDIMRDQMAPFADPHVSFECKTIEDSKGLNYIVIEIFSFRDIPVICRRDDKNAEIYGGRVYYRNSNRRPESAAISNSYDMRDLIETATIKMMQKKKEQELDITNGKKDVLDKELGGL